MGPLIQGRMGGPWELERGAALVVKWNWTGSKDLEIGQFAIETGAFDSLGGDKV
jgi:hypothetical protein